MNRRSLPLERTPSPGGLSTHAAVPQNRDVHRTPTKPGQTSQRNLDEVCPSSGGVLGPSRFWGGTIGGMRIFGLTGNIGSGKSTVAALLREHGIPVLDADRISREVTAPGGRAYDAVVDSFGRGILGRDGSIDRKRLGESVFSDAGRGERVERIPHPPTPRPVTVS